MDLYGNMSRGGLKNANPPLTKKPDVVSARNIVIFSTVIESCIRFTDERFL